MPLIAGDAVALSGGGYRATLFQIGTIIRLNQLGLLKGIKCFSSVSGGSITSAFLGMQWANLRFQGNVAANLDEAFVTPLRQFCARSLDIAAAVSGLVNPFEHPSEELAKAYKDHLFGNKTLQDLPDASTGNAPEFTINATNLQTGVCFRFARAHVGDYRIGYAPNPTTLLAEAVAASSAFPPFFAPHVLDLSALVFSPAGAKSDLADRRDLQSSVALCDGGVYDNMGLEAVWNSYDSVWVSDAGSPLDVQASIPTDWLRLMMRVVDLLMRSSLARRRQDLIALYAPLPGAAAPQRKGTYWGISTDITKYGTAGALICTPAKIQRLAELGTRLTSFDEKDQCELINWGYALADAGLRKYALLPGAPKPEWPFANYAL